MLIISEMQKSKIFKEFNSCLKIKDVTDKRQIEKISIPLFCMSLF